MRTEGGTPHVIANDFGSLGYGFGDAFAQDDICSMANDYITVEAQRSRYFGPDGSYLQGGNGVTVGNLDSDVFWQDIIDRGVVDHLLATKTGPDAIGPSLRQLLAGYVAGYNAFLAGVGGPAGISDPACHGQPWVHPITVKDAFLRFYQLVLLASQDVAIPGIAEAAPPTAGVVPAGLAGPAQIQVLGQRMAADGIGGNEQVPAGSGALGSNAVAVGSAGTADHTHGLLLGNPHFPWDGTERFYQAQLTIPGKFDVEGSMLFGVPLVLIGHTATMAWSHTVSTAYRFTPYQLTLVPGKPTSYLFDGKPVAMKSHTVTVVVKQSNGSLTRKNHTLWSTQYGPVFTSLEGVPLPWTAATAFAMRDANADNFRVFNHFFLTDQATSAAQELQILKTYEGIPWVNTIVADSGGHALYADVGAVPHVTDAEAQQCDTVLGAATFKLIRLPVLDGSRSACGWGSDPDAVEPGLFGGAEMPQLFRDDYVENSNDSYWLSNPHQPLGPYPLIIGDYDTARSLRTRIGLIMTDSRVHGTDGLGPAGFSRQDMQNEVFSDRQYGGELVDNDLVAMCRSFPGGFAPTTANGVVPVGSSCDVLANWDRHEDLTSRGAVLFRDFWERALALQESPWKNAFSAGDPVNTPNGLNTSDPRVQQAFGDALADMSSAHLPYDVPLGQVQYVVRNGQRIPLHGGPGDPDGDFNAIYQDVVHHPGQDPSIGSSYIQVVTWHSGDSCPDAVTLISYSLSENPRSPYYDDQTKLFSAKQWLPERYCTADVQAHAVSRTTLAS